MTLEKFQIILGRVSNLCDKACKNIEEKRKIENGLIELWNDYRELEDNNSK